MPAVLVELFEGRTETIANRSRAEIQYAVFDAVDEDDVRATAAAGIPANYPSLPGLLLSEQEITRRVNETTWIVTARFDSGTYTDPDDPSQIVGNVESFDTTGGVQRITQSLSTIASYPESPPAPNPAPDFQGAINFDGKKVQGVDIVVPVYNFSIQKNVPNATVDVAFRKQIADLTGTVNDAAFEGFDAGEVLFLGAIGNRTAVSEWEIQYLFSRTPNLVNQTIGTLTGIDKKGWEYLWVRYSNGVDQDAIVKQPKHVYVEQVYEDGDFTLLGI